MKKLLIFLSILAVSILIFKPPVFATTYELIPPSGQLNRGQEIKFTINIDTEGSTITSPNIGMTYETQYLEYVSVTPGETMNNVSVNKQGGGKLIITGTSNAGFSGKGVLAYVNLKIIAAAPGSSQLCVLWAPEAPVQPTDVLPTTVIPTAMPKTGSVNKTTLFAVLGFVFVISSATVLYLTNDMGFEKAILKKSRSKTRHKSVKKHNV